MDQVLVFWHAHDNPERQKWLSAEFSRGKLRQGWGPPGSSLLENGSRIPLDKWRIRYLDGIKKYWKPPAERFNEYRVESGSRYEILSRMIGLRRGALVVVPKMPDNAHDSIVQVQDGYQFHIAEGQNDFGHVLSVDPGTVAAVAHGSNSDAVRLHALCVDYRSAVRFVRKPENVELVNRVYRDSSVDKVVAFDASKMPAVDMAAPERISVTVDRIRRDPEKVRLLKELYKYKCQICSERLESPLFDGPDRACAEVHHLRPLGGEHIGLDNWNNMLVLCPNCHVLFDCLALAIHPKTGRVVKFKNKSAALRNEIRFLRNHNLDPENIAFHWRRFRAALNAAKQASESGIIHLACE